MVVYRGLALPCRKWEARRSESSVIQSSMSYWPEGQLMVGSARSITGARRVATAQTATSQKAIGRVPIWHLHRLYSRSQNRSELFRGGGAPRAPARDHDRGC